LWNAWELHQSTPADQRQPAVGLLTSEHRDRWTEAYQHLQTLGENNSTLRAIEESLFAVSLDLFPAAEDVDTSHRIFFHGQNGRNRWFDKSLTFVVTNNGRAGCNGEHSPSDAIVPGRIIGDILARYN
jgi:carnitine O-acetyltransferase